MVCAMVAEKEPFGILGDGRPHCTEFGQHVPTDGVELLGTTQVRYPMPWRCSKWMVVKSTHVLLAIGT
jgi:hypothetical protein